MKTNFFASVSTVFMVLSLILSACGSFAPVATATALPSATATNTALPIFTPTTTLTPTRTPTPTATPNLTATQQYNDFMAVVQKIYDAGQISTMEGTYIKLDNFHDQLSMNYGYRWSPTGVAPKNFIVSADFDWEVANQENYSGCGYVFRQTSEDHYYMVSMDALNGALLFYTKVGLNEFGRATTIHTPIRASKKESLPDVGNNPYHAKVTLVVNESNADLYVNDEFYSEHRLLQDKLLDAGDLSYLVLTGSDKDYGTRCKITNSEMWVIEP